MKKIWNDKKIEKIYEEILPINNEVYFIKTFVHFDSSVSEQVMFFHNFNNNMKILIQTKNYQNINEYKNDFVLCEEILINKNNNKYQLKENNIKNFLKQHNNFKLKPTKTENILWLISILLPTIAVIIGIFHPPALIVGCIGLAIKTCTSFFILKQKRLNIDDIINYVKIKKKKKKKKKEHESIIKNLTSDKIETRLETQFNMLKQELDNRKKQNPNNLLENSSIQSENNQNFDSSIKNSVNHQDLQPSTSTIYHSNSML